MKESFKTGKPFIWMTAMCLAVILGMLITMCWVVFINGIGVMWPSRVVELELHSGNKVMGELKAEEEMPEGKGTRIQLKTGNREMYGLDFRWIELDKVKSRRYPEQVIVLEREEYGNFYGYVKNDRNWDSFYTLWQKVMSDKAKTVAKREEISVLSEEIEALRRKQQKLAYQEASQASIDVIEKERRALEKEFEKQVSANEHKESQLKEHVANFRDADGREKQIHFEQIVRAFQPNRMSFVQKGFHYVSKVGELLLDDPREANTEGGIFPAIFGTVMLVFIMSICSFPVGVMAGIYLKEYAKDGPVVRVTRIAVNNLAGIPSIVFGIFGLGFFIYGIGGTIDQVFFPERLPTPTFGTGGILWASLTLGLMTVPVVIVATEEALGVIPQGIREASVALGATKFQTLCKVLLPMASPGILTGFILAMSRAAGEVAPLMITGVVKLAPSLPLDGSFPFLHLERKFMHLGFHIYDVGFQSPNVEAAKPMVFVTTLLLLIIVLVMSSSAILLRNRMRKKFSLSTL